MITQTRPSTALLEPTWDVLFVTDAMMTVHLDRGDDSGVTRALLAAQSLAAKIAARA